MKKTALAALLLLAAPLVAQSGPGRGPGNGTGNPGTGTPAAPAVSPLATYVASLPVEALSSAETSQLLYLREEEKLARDVYRALFAANGDRSFANIAGAEQRHMDDVKLLLDRYGLADPAAATARGVQGHPSRLALHRPRRSWKGVARRGAESRRHDRGPRPLRRRQGARRRRQPRHRRGDAEPCEGLAQSPSGLLVPPDGSRAPPTRRSTSRPTQVAAIVAAPHERGAYDETGKLLAGTCTGQGRGGRGQGRGRGPGAGAGSCDGTGAGTGAGRGPGDGTGPSCPNK